MLSIQFIDLNYACDNWFDLYIENLILDSMFESDSYFAMFDPFVFE